MQGALGCSGNELQDPISPAISKCKPPFHSTGLHCLPLQDSPRADGQMWTLHLAEEEAAQAGMGAGLPGTPPWGGGLSGPPRPMQLPHPPAPSASPPTAQLTGFLDHHIHPSWQVRSTSFLFECPLICLSDPSPLSPAV